jgi:RND family efflux transporter MFP subunit
MASPDTVGPGPRRRPGAGLVLALAAGCAQPPPPPEPVRPVRTAVVAAGDETHVRQFPGKVEAARKAELAFQVPGLLVDLPVKEGQAVKKGEVIARLRPDEFKARLDSLKGRLDQARAALTALRAGERTEQRRRLEAEVRAGEAKLANARAEMDRMDRGLRAAAVSRTDFDVAVRNYKLAQENLEAARQALEKGQSGREEDIEAQEGAVRGLEGQVVEADLQLADTTLRAPFDGVIARRFVEQSQNVPAKQPVVRFQDVDEVEIKVDVPEAVMATVRAADIVSLAAEVAGAPGVQFPVALREVGQVADPVTQTFQARVVMKSPDGVRVLPGMTATATLTYRRAAVLGDRILVPVAAVSKQPAGEQVVWVLGPDGAVSPRPVKLGAATGDRVEVPDGLRPGDRVVVAGVRFLRDGMKVRDLGDALGGERP